MDSSSSTSPKTPLLEGENILWQSRSGKRVEGGYQIPFIHLSALLAVLLLSTVFPLWFYWGDEDGIPKGVIIWAVIAVVPVFYLVKAFFPSKDLLEKKSYEQYFITDRRLIVERETGTLRQSFFDRPFNFIGVQTKRGATNITLATTLDSEPDDTEIMAELIAIDNSALAEKLLTENFIRGKNNE